MGEELIASRNVTVLVVGSTSVICPSASADGTGTPTLTLRANTSCFCLSSMVSTYTRSPFLIASWVVSAPLRKMCVRSSNATFQWPPPNTLTVILLWMWSTPLTIPPTSVALPSGSGGGSRIGSCPSVTRPEEVAELSKISVFGRSGSGSTVGSTRGSIAGSDNAGSGATAAGGCEEVGTGAVTEGIGATAAGFDAGPEMPPMGVLGAPDAGCGW